MFVAMECGFVEALALLKTKEYISPTHTLQLSRFNISEEEEPYFYEGCVQAVANTKTNQKHNS